MSQDRFQATTSTMNKQISALRDGPCGPFVGILLMILLLAVHGLYRVTDILVFYPVRLLKHFFSFWFRFAETISWALAVTAIVVWDNLKTR